MADREDEDNRERIRLTGLQVELYWGMINLVLGSLASTSPAWLHAITLPAWYVRYAGLQARVTMPQTPQQRQSLIRVVRADILYLLDMIEQSNDEGLKSFPEVLALRKMKADVIGDDP